MAKVVEFPQRGRYKKEKIINDIKLEKEIRETVKMVREVFTDEFLAMASRKFSGIEYEENRKKRMKYLRELQEFEDLIGGKHQIADIRGVN